MLPEDSNGPPAVILSMDIHLRYIIYWTLSIPSLRLLRSDAVSGHRRRWTIRGSIPLLMMFTASSLHPIFVSVRTTLTVRPSLLSTLMDPTTDILSRAESSDFRVPAATLANLSQIIFAAQNHVLLGIRYEQSNLKESVIEIVILTMFFGPCTFLSTYSTLTLTGAGLFTILIAVATYILLCVLEHLVQPCLCSHVAAAYEVLRTRDMRLCLWQSSPCGCRRSHIG